MACALPDEQCDAGAGVEHRGRGIEVVAVTARSRNKDRGVDLKKLQWFADPVALAKAPGIDVFVELIGGSGDPAKSAIEAALASGDKAAATTALAAAQPELMRGVSKGVLHKNTASRKFSRLTKRVSALA